MLRCIVIDFFLNNQTDALIIPILFCYKTLHVSGIFSARHQEFSTVNSALVSFIPVMMTASKQSHPDSAWKRSSKSCVKLINTEWTVENSWWCAKRLPETCRVLWQNKIGIISASVWLLKKSGTVSPFPHWSWWRTAQLNIVSTAPLLHSLNNDNTQTALL